MKKLSGYRNSWVYLKSKHPSAQNTKIIVDIKTPKDLMAPGMANLERLTDIGGCAYRLRSTKGTLLHFAINNRGRRFERRKDILHRQEWNGHMAVWKERLAVMNNEPFLAGKPITWSDLHRTGYPFE